MSLRWRCEVVLSSTWNLLLGPRHLPALASSFSAIVLQCVNNIAPHVLFVTDPVVDDQYLSSMACDSFPYVARALWGRKKNCDQLTPTPRLERSQAAFFMYYNSESIDDKAQVIFEVCQSRANHWEGKPILLGHCNTNHEVSSGAIVDEERDTNSSGL